MFDNMADWFMAGGWIWCLPLLCPLYVLVATAWVLIAEAVTRHHARQDGDYITEYKHRQP